MDRIDMATQLVLITASPADSWVQQISDMASKGVVELAILAPEQVAPGLTGPDFDVALVDASSMTVMKEIVAALRARSAAKIIVVTVVRSWQEAREAFRAGADDYRLKSFDSGELRRLIEPGR